VAVAYLPYEWERWVATGKTSPDLFRVVFRDQLQQWGWK
jgi:hypothetical protein